MKNVLKTIKLLWKILKIICNRFKNKELNTMVNSLETANYYDLKQIRENEYEILPLAFKLEVPAEIYKENKEYIEKQAAQLLGESMASQNYIKFTLEKKRNKTYLVSKLNFIEKD